MSWLRACLPTCCNSKSKPPIAANQESLLYRPSQAAMNYFLTGDSKDDSSIGLRELQGDVLKLLPQFQKLGQTLHDQLSKDYNRAGHLFLKTDSTMQTPLSYLINPDLTLKEACRDFSPIAKKLIPLLLNQNFQSLVMMPFSLIFNRLFECPLPMPLRSTDPMVIQLIFAIGDHTIEGTIVNVQVLYTNQVKDQGTTNVNIKYEMAFDNEFIQREDKLVKTELGVKNIIIRSVKLTNPQYIKLAYDKLMDA